MTQASNNRRKIAAANWKMYKSPAEAQQFLDNFCQKDVSPNAEVHLYINALALGQLAQSDKPNNLFLGAQNFYPQDDGAYTGEISLPMLQSINIRHVLVGHSERRHLFGENLALIADKTNRAITQGYTAILCVGETQAQREAGQTEAVLREQITTALQSKHLQPGSSGADVIVAYEPVWAIGTGLTATPELAAEAHKTVRDGLDSILPGAGARISILYGGSVKPANIADLLQQEQVDGVLVGGASLAVDSWCDIVNAF